MYALCICNIYIYTVDLLFIPTCLYCMCKSTFESAIVWVKMCCFGHCIFCFSVVWCVLIYFVVIHISNYHLDHDRWMLDVAGRIEMIVPGVSFPKKDNIYTYLFCPTKNILCLPLLANVTLIYTLFFWRNAKYVCTRHCWINK